MEFFIVTGASRGLGAAITEQALQKGHQVAAIARSSIKSRERLETFQQDLNEIDALPHLMREVLSRHDLAQFTAIHLINNAAMLEPIGPVPHLDAHELDKNIRTNLVAPMALTAAFLKETHDFKGMRTVVNVSSRLADSPLASWSAYSASKSGLKNFTHALALELKDEEKTKIISFSPGLMDTEMQATIRRQTKKTFAEVERFKRYRSEGQLRPPETVANTLLKFLENPTRLSRVDLNAFDHLNS